MVVAERFFPSSKTCRGCGPLKATRGLSEREYICGECGLVRDCDLNAALN